jgi:methionine-rich copper-binding protein CopC
MADRSTVVKTIGGVITIITFLAIVVSFANAVSSLSQSNSEDISQNKELIKEIQLSLSDEIEQRKDGDVSLADRINNQAMTTEKGFSDVQVKLSEIDMKLDTNLTYLIKAIDKLEDDK